MVTAEFVGQLVTDGYRTGVLIDVVKDWEDPTKLPDDRRKVTTAFVRPEHGGIEWTSAPDFLSPV